MTERNESEHFFIHAGAMRCLFELRQGEKPITCQAFVIGSAFATFMAKKDGTCYPAVKTIARFAGVSEREVHRHLRSLEHCFLKIERRAGPKKCHRYTLTNSHPLTDSHPDREYRKGVTNSPKRGDRESGKRIKNEIRTSTSASSEAASPSEKKLCSKEGKINGQRVWGMWIDLHRRLGKRDPVSAGPDTKAGKCLAAGIRKGEYTQAELQAAMEKFLADNDSFLAKQGYALRLLSGRMNAYLSSSTEMETNERRKREFENASSIK